MKWLAVAKDGADLPTQQTSVLDAMQTISVGETYDFKFAPQTPGDYELRFSSDLGNEVTQNDPRCFRQTHDSAFSLQNAESDRTEAREGVCFCYIECYVEVWRWGQVGAWTVVDILTETF
jgi:hypothetical protein